MKFDSFPTGLSSAKPKSYKIPVWGHVLKHSELQWHFWTVVFKAGGKMYQARNLSETLWNIAKIKSRSCLDFQVEGRRGKSLYKIWGLHRTCDDGCSRNRLCSDPWCFGLIEQLFVKGDFLISVKIHETVFPLPSTKMHIKKINHVSSFKWRIQPHF